MLSELRPESGAIRIITLSKCRETALALCRRSTSKMNLVKNSYDSIAFYILAYALAACLFTCTASRADAAENADVSLAVLHFSSESDEAVLLRTTVPDDWGDRGGIFSEVLWWRSGRVEQRRSLGIMFGAVYCEIHRALYVMKPDGIYSVVRNEDVITVENVSKTGWPLRWSISNDNELMAVYHHDMNLNRGSVVFYRVAKDGKLVETVRTGVDRLPKALWLSGDPVRYLAYLEFLDDPSLMRLEYVPPGNADGGPVVKRSDFEMGRIVGVGDRGLLFSDGGNRLYEEGVEEPLAQLPFTLTYALKEGNVIALFSDEGNVYELRMPDEAPQSVKRFAGDVSARGVWARGLYISTLNHDVYVVTILDGSVRLVSLGNIDQ